MTKEITAVEEVKRALKAPKAFFDWTKTFFKVYQWENKSKTIISTDDPKRLKTTCEIVKKRLTKKSKLDLFEAHTFVYVAASAKRVEIQSYRVVQRIKNGQESFETYIVNLERFEHDKHTKFHAYIGNDGEVVAGTGLRSTSMSGGVYGNTYCYNISDKEVLKRFRALKYIDLDNLLTGNVDIIYQLPYLYKYRDRIEYAQKIGATKIAEAIVDLGMSGYYGYYYSKKVHMGRLTMNFLKRNKAVLRQHNLSFKQLEFYNLSLEKYGFVKMDILPILESYSSDLIKSFVELENAKPDGIGIEKFQNYLIKQKDNIISYQSPIRVYNDYIRMLVQLEVPLTSKSILLPKNLHEAHDKASKEIKFIKNEAKQEQYAERLKNLLKLETSVGDYQFVVPKKLHEIATEGTVLHHCVGSYTDRVAEGKTVIIFVRAKEKPQEPLYTMEINHGSIIQLRGKRNCKPSDDADEAAQKFLAYAKKEKVSF